MSETATISDAARFTTIGAKDYLQSAPIAPQPPPLGVGGPLAWVRRNLLSSPFNAFMTVMGIALVALTVPDLVRFYLLDAVWTGSNREACLPETAGRPVGACWAFVAARLQYFIYGSYPLDQRWRVDIVFVMGAIGIVWLLWDRIPYKRFGAIYFFIILPVAAFLLLHGSFRLGIPVVPTNLWGGLMVTMVVSAVGIVVSLPFGIVLALGRRSKLPMLKFLSVLFIEFVRGVPLITVLFMANVMLPLFVPADWSPDRLLRPMIGVALFASAYMAEVVRGGLQAIPKGQYEGAMSLGLGYGAMMRLIILPQALRIVIPGIVNTFIGLFKDTTLLLIVGIFDFLRTVEASLTDPIWATPNTRATAYAFAAIVYFMCCWGMSRYALSVERKLAAGQKR